MIDGVSRTRAVLTAAVLLSALALGGCSDDEPEPKFAPPSKAPTSPSTTAASGPIEPTMPTAAKRHDAAAAEAFVKHYWAMANYAQATGDVSGLEDLSLRCTNCDHSIASVQQVYQGGGTIRGGENRATRLKTTFLLRPAGDWAVVELDLLTKKQEVDLPGSSDDLNYPGGRTGIRMMLEPSGDSWVVRSMVKR